MGMQMQCSSSATSTCSREKKTKRLCREAKPAWNRCHLFQLEENTTQCNRDETGTETCNHSERVNT